MAYTSVRVLFEIGHEASIRAKKTADGFTHDWELFVRGVENSEIHHFVEKVIFHLHETFQNPKRVIKEPPYVVRESGYAGFSLFVDIYFKSKPEPTKIRFKYQLTLQDAGPPISNVTREEYVFNNPPEDFRRKLIKGGGVGVGEESTSGSHMAAVSSSQSDVDHKNSLKNKCSPLDLPSTKKLKKENTPKNEEKLNANDPFSIFGQPINTSKIPLLPKSNSKLISEKNSQSDKQVHSSKPLKHNISSHKDKDKDKDREKEKEKEREKEKHKTKDRDKDKEKSQIKKSKDESLKKDRNKEDKMKILKSFKEDSKKNAYHEEKLKEKITAPALVIEKSEKELKAEKKDKEKKHKEEKKLKSKDKHNKNGEKKENIDLAKENYGGGDRMRSVDKQQPSAPTSVVSKDENAPVVKEEKKSGRKLEDSKDEKLDTKIKEKSTESKSLCNNNNGSLVNSLSSSNTVAGQRTANSILDVSVVTKKEEKHKHHKHKKDKSKKDSKRDKEDKKEKLKESKGKSTPPAPVAPPPAPQPSVLLESAKITPKLESPKNTSNEPLKRLFNDFSSDKSDSDSSGVDDDPHPSAPVKVEPVVLDIPVNAVKEEPMTEALHNNINSSGNDNNVLKSVVVDEPTVRDVELESAPKKKKSKKSTEEKEAKKRKRKSKDKVLENVIVPKLSRYENQTTDHSTNAIKSNSLIEMQHHQQGTRSESRQTSLSPVSGTENKFTDEYVTKLKELQRKIMTLEDNSGLQRIVQLVAETGQYEITTKTFDFDLCSLDESIVQRLSDFFLP